MDGLLCRDSRADANHNSAADLIKKEYSSIRPVQKVLHNFLGFLNEMGYWSNFSSVVLTNYKHIALQH